MTLTKGNLILTISQAWLLLLLEKSKMYTQSCAQEHANIIMVSFILLKYINFCSRQFGIILMMKFVSLSFYGLANMMISGSVTINYQKKKIKRAHKKYCLIVFYRAVIFSAAVFKVTFFFSFPNRYICMIVKSFSPCVNVQLFVIHSLKKLRI